MMSKLFYIFFLPLSLGLFVSCGPNNDHSSQDSKSLTANLSSARYVYSLETSKSVTWSSDGNKSPMDTCQTDYYVDLLASLSSSKVQPGLLNSDQYHTADNPFHKLTLTYFDGSKKVFNLHTKSSYQNEKILSNTDRIIEIFENYLSSNSCD